MENSTKINKPQVCGICHGWENQGDLQINQSIGHIGQVSPDISTEYQVLHRLGRAACREVPVRLLASTTLPANSLVLCPQLRADGPRSEAHRGADRSPHTSPPGSRGNGGDNEAGHTQRGKGSLVAPVTIATQSRQRFAARSLSLDRPSHLADKEVESSPSSRTAVFIHGK